MDLKQQNKLLYARSGFGWNIDQYRHPRPVKELIAGLFPSAAPRKLETVTAEEWAANNPKTMKMMELEADEKKAKERSFRDRINDLNRLWIDEMVATKYPLQEKMSLFWHGHFASHVNNPWFDQGLLHEIRTHATGNFGDLLTAVSKSPSMLQYLNNQQNKKKHPNENFAREVMELFTLGRGNYSEGDVKEAARAFTGWGYDDEGHFIFREKQHDTGKKTILGKTGNFDGDDVIRILLEQKQTARFITKKIYRFFVADEFTDERQFAELADRFYESNYNIADLLRVLFSAEWFYTDKVQAAKIKSPVELLVGYMRLIPVQFNNEKTIINLQRALGQLLFYPPNVAGWPGGKQWIDSSSLMLRMRLPEALFASKEIDLSLKEITPEMGRANGQKAERFKLGQAAADWNGFISSWKESYGQGLPALLADFLLPAAISKEALSAAERFTDKDNNDEQLKSLTILLMKMPEYQLC